MDLRLQPKLIAGVVLAIVAGCSVETIRPGTDRSFFLNLNGTDGAARLKKLSQSASFFTREMTERGASCGDARKNGNTTRVVCVYAVCHNGGVWSDAWQFDVKSAAISTPKDASLFDQENCDGNRLKDVQQAAVKKLILAAGEEVL